MKSKKVALSFFSGALGLDLGIERAGFDIRVACEFDKFCRETIALNRPNLPILEDINRITPAMVLKTAGLKSSSDVDLIFGGPPCQAFSTAGKRTGFTDERGNAFLTYISIALSIKPKFIVIENVRGLLSCPLLHRPHNFRGEGFTDLTDDEQPGGALRFILSLMKRGGYEVSFNLYNSANFGTPQSRERVVAICSRDGGKPPYLIPTHSETGDDGLPKWRTFRDATAGMTEHNYIDFPEKRLVYYRMLKEGQNWRALSPDLQRKALGKSFFAGGGKTGFFRRLAWDRPAPTLVTHPAMPATDLAHPEANRPLSIEEYKRIQEFPDDWKLAGPLLQQYKQVGNAVPAGLGNAIGSLLMMLLRNQAIPSELGTAFSRYKNTSDRLWAMDRH